MEQELKMSIPIRIVKNTFEHLRMKEAMQKEAFRIEDSKSKMNLGTGSEESNFSQGSNELINLGRRTISGFPSKESVEDEDVENLNVVQENLIIISTAMKGIKKNVRKSSKPFYIVKSGSLHVRSATHGRHPLRF